MSTKRANLPLKVLILEAQPLYREGLTRLVGDREHWTLCRPAGDDLAACEVTSADQPDLIVLSLAFSFRGGLELLRKLKNCCQTSRILATSENDDPQYVERALKAGADGFLLKTDSSAEVAAALESVAEGELYLSPRLYSKILRRCLANGNGRNHTGIESLSDRELRVFELLGERLTTREIAEKLFLSRKTVDSHRENIKRKLALPSTLALRRFAGDWVQDQSSQPPQSTSSVEA
jgi:DNA-binding NarL/FixJ family response regulator